MNILYVALNFSPEIVGCAKFSSEFVDWFSNKSNKIIVITTNPFYPKWESKSNSYKITHEKNIVIVRCPIYIPKKINGLTRILHYISFFITTTPMILFFGLKKVDLAFNMCPTILSAPNLILVSFLRKLFFKKKLATWIHFADLEIDAAFQIKFLRNRIIKNFLLTFEKILLRNFDLISAISFYMIKQIRSKVQTNKKIYYLPDFIETKEFNLLDKEKKLNPYFQELKLNNKNTVIMYSGTLNEKLAYDILIDSIKILKHRKDLIWIICGEGIKKNYFIKKLKNYSNVKFYNFQPYKKLPEWLNIADIHLIPQKLSSVKFCLPSKLLGILASGKPVIGIAPKDSELGNILDKYGIRVSKEEPYDMVNAITKLVDNKELRMQLSKKSKNYIKDFHEKENIFNTLLLEITKIINS